MDDPNRVGFSKPNKKSVDELRRMYLEIIRRPPEAAKNAIGDPRNEGPDVKLLIDCAEDLAANYEPSGAIFIVENEPDNE